MGSQALPEGRPRMGHDRAWLPISAAADALGVSTSTLRAWAASGEVPHVRTAGGHRRFDPDDLAAWLASRPAPGRPREERSTRMAPRAGLARMLEERAMEVVARAHDAYGLGADQRRAAREWVLMVARALRTGRLGPALDRAGAVGRAHGAAGTPADATIAGPLAIARAADDVLARHHARTADRDHVDAAMRRLVVRMADAWARATAGS
jgi:excisionase family DNA binding protein